MFKVRLACGIFLAFLLLATVNLHSVYAQSPSTDVVPKNHLYLELDLVSHLEPHAKGGFQAIVPKATFGVARGLEVGANFAFVDALQPDLPVELQPNAKWQFYRNERRGVDAAGGAVLYLPIAHRRSPGADTFGSVYAMVSKRIKKVHGPRFTFGGYRLLGYDTKNGDRTGAIFAYEQPLHRKVMFIADTFRGKNRFGYVTPSLLFQLPRRSILYAGYSIGNQGRKNNGINLRYGMMF